MRKRKKTIMCKTESTKKRDRTRHKRKAQLPLTLLGKRRRRKMNRKAHLTLSLVARKLRKYWTIYKSKIRRVMPCSHLPSARLSMKFNKPLNSSKNTN